MKKILFLMGIFWPVLNYTVFAEQNLEKLIPQNLSVAMNGKFIHRSDFRSSKANSVNGRFACEYEIKGATDEIREIRNFRLYENSQLCYQSDEIPGSDFYISNSGIVASLDTRQHFRNLLTIHFYAKDGRLLLSHSINGASLFGFSVSGNLFGVGSAKQFFLISLEKNQILQLEGGSQFDISEDDQLISIAKGATVRIYSGEILLREFQTGFHYPRKVKISARDQILAVIGKKQLKVFSLKTGKLEFTANLPSRYSFRDLKIVEGKILTGVHFKHANQSNGILRIYDLKGSFLLEKTESTQTIPVHPKTSLQKKTLNRNTIPWPFYPFDQTPTVWNYYEQHMGGYGTEFSYLHQGLDIITPVGEHTFAVADGIVKCVLTLGGDIYWRIAVSPEQTADYSKGWLYAHLIENTIQFDVGDTVQVYDYLGDIIHWHADWGHIHFVEISDSGLVWQYDDNEWGITFNPLLVLDPVTDPHVPTIENVFKNQKFAFCLNETSTYLKPDSLFGKFDIITKIVDYVGDSDWQLPAYETFYWVKSLESDSIVFPRTLGQRLNHSYPFYAGGNYEPFATLMYKRDELLVPSTWMSKYRNFYHILTNNNGDSLALLSEKNRAFYSLDYPDGDYQIFVEARDISGNTIVDSMDVKFKNQLTNSVDQNSPVVLKQPQLHVFPNPFNSATQIEYYLPESTTMQLQVFDVLGRMLKGISEKQQAAGTHTIRFEADKLASGVYWIRLQTPRNVLVKKMVLLQ